MRSAVGLHVVQHALHGRHATLLGVPEGFCKTVGAEPARSMSELLGDSVGEQEEFVVWFDVHRGDMPVGVGDDPEW